MKRLALGSIVGVSVMCSVCGPAFAGWVWSPAGANRGGSRRWTPTLVTPITYFSGAANTKYNLSLGAHADAEVLAYSGNGSCDAAASAYEIRSYRWKNDQNLCADCPHPPSSTPSVSTSGDAEWNMYTNASKQPAATSTAHVSNAATLDLSTDYPTGGSTTKGTTSWSLPTPITLANPSARVWSYSVGTGTSIDVSQDSAPFSTSSPSGSMHCSAIFTVEYDAGASATAIAGPSITLQRANAIAVDQVHGSGP